MKWGAIGGVVGLLASLLGSLAGIVAAAFVGVACGRASVEDSGDEDRNGALDGLMGGSLAVPVFVVGAAAGALLSARWMGMETLAAEMGSFTGTEFSPSQVREVLLTGILIAGAVQAFVVMGTAALAGARRSKKS